MRGKPKLKAAQKGEKTMKMKIALLCVTLITIYTLPSRFARASGSFDSATVNAPALLSVSAEWRNTNSQDEPYIWVNFGEEQDHPGYRRVLAGMHQDGNKMYVCRGWGGLPGKFYRNQCYFPFNGGEIIDKEPPKGNPSDPFYMPPIDINPQLLLTNIAEPAWVNISKLSLDRIEKAAVKGGQKVFEKDKEPLFICRRQMNDGVHPGKYHPATQRCYVSWNGKEQSFTSDFEVLMMPPPTVPLPVIKSGLPKKP